MSSPSIPVHHTVPSFSSLPLDRFRASSVGTEPSVFGEFKAKLISPIGTEPSVIAELERPSVLSVLKTDRQSLKRGRGQFDKSDTDETTPKFIPPVPSFHSDVGQSRKKSGPKMTEIEAYLQAQQEKNKPFQKIYYQKVAAIAAQRRDEKSKDREFGRVEILNYLRKVDPNFEFSFPNLIEPKITPETEDRILPMRVAKFTLDDLQSKSVVFTTDDLIAILYKTFDAVCKLLEKRAYAIINAKTVVIFKSTNAFNHQNNTVILSGVRPVTIADTNVRTQFAILCQELQPNFKGVPFVYSRLGNIARELLATDEPEREIMNRIFGAYVPPDNYITPKEFIQRL